jgi:DNA-binding transcriptional LysR family regulator
MLTPEGRNLLERTQRLLREAEGIEQGVAATPRRAEPAGTLKVTAPLPVGVNILALALRRFADSIRKGWSSCA